MLTRRVALLATLALAVPGALATATPAQAKRGPGNPTPDTSGGTISITVTGTGVRGGSDGSGGGTRTVTTPVPCTYIQSMTGKEYYEYVKGGGPMGRDVDGNPFEPYPGYEQYKDDDKGHWYGGMCSSANFDGNLDEFFDFSDKWFEEHKGVYVEAGGTPPIPPIPPEILRNVAFDELTVPAPTLDWNPKHNGDAATLVNLDTWVWLTDRREDLYVRASVNTMAGPAWAQVDAKLTGMTVSAPNADTVECPGGGVPYAAGATGECALTFFKASPGQGTSPVTAKTTWATTWQTQAGPQGATPEQLDPPPATTNIRVIEVQVPNR